MKIFSFLILFTLSSQAANELEKAKINYLINSIEKSGATFIRNGSSHSAKEAGDHIRSKYKRATEGFLFFSGDKNVTATRFIQEIASQSSSSGLPYLIQPQGAKKPQKMDAWLHKKLKLFQKK